MNESNIQLGSGTFYITDKECTMTLGEITEIETAPEFEPKNDDKIRKLRSAYEEFAMTLTLSTREVERLMRAFLNLDKAVMDFCPNRRVVHLATHARKQRTRKKNRRRAYKILEKEADKK